MKSRVAIVDDHTLLADACRKLLEPDYDVVGTYSDPRAFLLDFPDLRVDVVILDITMPLLNGLDTARELRKLDPSLTVSGYLARSPARNFETGAIWSEALRRADLPA